jgi:hypothetical protein
MPVKYWKMILTPSRFLGIPQKRKPWSVGWYL